MPPAIVPEWLGLKLAAAYTNSSAKTVSRWIKTGEIKYTKLPSGTIKVRRAELDHFMEKYAIEAVDLEETVKGLLSGLVNPKGDPSQKTSRTKL